MLKKDQPFLTDEFLDELVKEVNRLYGNLANEQEEMDEDIK
jgi:hypothetical protein